MNATALDRLIDATDEREAAAALKALRNETEGRDGLRLALYDAFPDDSHGLLDAVADAAMTSPARAAAALFA